jgi:hypothetical protein
VSCNDTVLGEDVAQLPAVVNHSDLPSLEVQLLDEHGLPTGPQGPEKLRLSVWRSTAQGSVEMDELRQEISVGRRGRVGSEAWCTLAVATLACCAGCLHMQSHAACAHRQARCNEEVAFSSKWLLCARHGARLHRNMCCLLCIPIAAAHSSVALHALHRLMHVMAAAQLHASQALLLMPSQ